MTWTEERVTTLKTMWNDGHSASQIAGRLGEITRNAVIGKAHRLGLSGRATTSRLPKVKHRPKKEAVALKSTPPAPPSNVIAFPVKHKTTVIETTQSEVGLPVLIPQEVSVAQISDQRDRVCLETLSKLSCRWPIGDPCEADFHFCGRESAHRLPYCEVHARRAYQPGTNKPVRQRREW